MEYKNVSTGTWMYDTLLEMVIGQAMLSLKLSSGWSRDTRSNIQDVKQETGCRTGVHLISPGREIGKVHTVCQGLLLEAQGQDLQREQAASKELRLSQG